MSQYIPSKERLEEIIKHLQKIMRIQDWDIELEYLSAIEMYKKTDDPSAIAECHRSRPHHIATIRINYEMHSMHDDVVGGWYNTLVHEMFHIVLDGWDYAGGFKDSDEGSIAKERLTCDLARMFINLYPESNFEAVSECKK